MFQLCYSIVFQHKFQLCFNISSSTMIQHLFQHWVSASVPALCFSICSSTVFQHLFQHSVSTSVPALWFSICSNTVFQHLFQHCVSASVQKITVSSYVRWPNSWLKELLIIFSFRIDFWSSLVVFLVVSFSSSQLLSSLLWQVVMLLLIQLSPYFPDPGDLFSLGMSMLLHLYCLYRPRLPNLKEVGGWKELCFLFWYQECL